MGMFVPFSALPISLIVPSPPIAMILMGVDGTIDLIISSA
jgi:hypothetical protein